MAAHQGSLPAADFLGKNFSRGECGVRNEIESRYYFMLARNIDRNLGVRLVGKIPLSAEEQEILKKRLASNDVSNTDAQILEYFFSSRENHK